MGSQPSGRHRESTYELARALRRPLTPAEAVLWKALRGKQLAGFRFRRQQPFGPYVADFFCPAAKLVVELDGESHLGREAADARRTAYLEASGLRVIRFWNPDVFDDLDTVLTAIYDACAARVRRETPGVEPPATTKGEGGTAATLLGTTGKMGSALPPTPAPPPQGGRGARAGRPPETP